MAHRWACHEFVSVVYGPLDVELSGNASGREILETAAREIQRVKCTRGDLTTCLALANRALSKADESCVADADKIVLVLFLLQYVELLLVQHEQRSVEAGLLSAPTATASPSVVPMSKVSRLLFLSCLERFTFDITRVCIEVLGEFTSLFRHNGSVTGASAMDRASWCRHAVCATVIASWTHLVTARAYAAVHKTLLEAAALKEVAAPPLLDEVPADRDWATVVETDPLAPAALAPLMLQACAGLLQPDWSVLRAGGVWPGGGPRALLPSIEEAIEWVIAPPPYSLPPPGAPTSTTARDPAYIGGGATVASGGWASTLVSSEACCITGSESDDAPALPELDAALVARGVAAHQLHGAEFQVRAVGGGGATVPRAPHAMRPQAQALGRAWYIAMQLQQQQHDQQQGKATSGGGAGSSGSSSGSSGSTGVAMPAVRGGAGV